ncbi:hypothetical protein UF75_0529 [Desulfosporosinus sp. I2]|nr:hypothetical protein UF75_0529 [Desulfosporosinus sp. I2]
MIYHAQRSSFHKVRSLQRTPLIGAGVLKVSKKMGLIMLIIHELDM